MQKTKDAVLYLKNGKTIHGIVIEQNIQPETVVMINYKNIEQLGKQAIHHLLDFIPVSAVRELDFCIK
ncbi:MAG: hypothetical protein IAF38_03705 [Bacteroidia bacterium]|nr:hypothetical protein [Bacteroidia bacterium]